MEDQTETYHGEPDAVILLDPTAADKVTESESSSVEGGPLNSRSAATLPPGTGLATATQGPAPATVDESSTAASKKKKKRIRYRRNKRAGSVGGGNQGFELAPFETPWIYAATTPTNGEEEEEDAEAQEVVQEVLQTPREEVDVSPTPPMVDESALVAVESSDGSGLGGGSSAEDCWISSIGREGVLREEENEEDEPVGGGNALEPIVILVQEKKEMIPEENDFGVEGGKIQKAIAAGGVAVAKMEAGNGAGVPGSSLNSGDKEETSLFEPSPSSTAWERELAAIKLEGIEINGEGVAGAKQRKSVDLINFEERVQAEVHAGPEEEAPRAEDKVNNNEVNGNGEDVLDASQLQARVSHHTVVAVEIGSQDAPTLDKEAQPVASQETTNISDFFTLTPSPALDFSIPQFEFCPARKPPQVLEAIAKADPEPNQNYETSTEPMSPTLEELVPMKPSSEESEISVETLSEVITPPSLDSMIPQVSATTKDVVEIGDGVENMESGEQSITTFVGLMSTESDSEQNFGCCAKIRRSGRSKGVKYSPAKASNSNNGNTITFKQRSASLKQRISNVFSKGGPPAAERELNNAPANNN